MILAATAAASALLPPRPDSAHGHELLNEITATFNRYLVLPAHTPEALTLWAAHTYLLDAFEHSPRLVLTSPVKRCGKTTTLAVASSLACNPLSITNASPAALFRVMDIARPTVLMDEADGWLVGDRLFRTILNGGYSRMSSKVLRYDARTHAPELFDAFGALAIAMIGEPEATVIDRSIVIRLRPKGRGEVVERYRSDRAAEAIGPLCARLQEWTGSIAGGLRAARPAIPGQLDDRAVDLWGPLLAIADAAGAHWSGRAREAAVQLSAHRLRGEPEAALQLLQDIRQIFGELHADRVPTKHLLLKLKALEGSPWAEWTGDRPLTAHQLAQLLRPFGLGPMTIRLADGSTPKGYKREDFEPLFEVYLDPPEGATPPHQTL